MHTSSSGCQIIRKRVGVAAIAVTEIACGKRSFKGVLMSNSRFDLSVLERAQRVPGKPRHKTREVKVGNCVFGGQNPIWVQSMTTTDTFDVEGTIKQIHALEEAGCELVRVTVPKPEDAGALSQIKAKIGIPLICDIHFDYKMALAALDHPVDKIRINPGNIGTTERFRQVVRKAKDRGIPMR